MRDIIQITRSLFENSKEHRKTFENTGFWGQAGAGCIFIAQDTGRILLAHRSKDVEQPHEWATWGGAIDDGEDAEQAVQREVKEETCYDGPKEIIPLYIFKKHDFNYSNFLIVVPEEFTPILDEENQGYV